eukprot:TRINITY_DN27605_c0_g1_i2.p1 TRINITY_DN27605_c0_g1~~TRINITY_DN27605_c0_g1_i2.p1  ORF type:complete len:262 (-),score=71.47 TRINITY_DN27605_c0_g1_i2:74-823(-)
MGTKSSVHECEPLVSYLQGEFDRLRKISTSQARSHNQDGTYETEQLMFQQVQQLAPPKDFPLDLGHIATLWKLDENHDGSVSFKEILNFAEFCNERQQALGDLDLQQKLKAHCVMEMWDAVCEERGEDAFADWVIKLISQGEQHKNFDVRHERDEASSGSRSVSFMQRDAVITLWELMKPCQIAAHVDQQGFLDLLQQIAETMGMQPLTNQELDDWVPVDVVRQWVKRFISALANLFRELGLERSSTTS